MAALAAAEAAAPSPSLKDAAAPKAGAASSKVGQAPPPVRSGGKISVKFSARAFRTPERESYKEEEEEVGRGSCTFGCSKMNLRAG